MKFKLIAIVISAILLIALIGCAQAATPGNANINSSQGINNSATLPDSEPAVTETEALPPAIPEPAEPAGPSTVTIGAIIDNSADYLGKEIILEGTIVNECGAGCWFNLQDDTGIVYVDLAPNNLYIPQKVGSKAKVYGVVSERRGTTYVIGSKVEF